MKIRSRFLLGALACLAATGIQTAAHAQSAPSGSVAADPAPAPAAAVSPTPNAEPLAGFSNGNAFLRSPDDSFVLFPNGRLQVDGYFFKSKNTVPNNGFLLRRARLELAGWVGSWFYFSIAGDFASGAPAGANPVAQTNLNTTDDFVAIAPWGDRAILQVGQFDAPFTLENRTSDKYFDFMERSITVRAFGIPSNKEMGAMLHGTDPARHYYYSAAVLNGDGQNFRNADNSFDVMGRAWLAPFSFGGPEALKAVTLGGSFWTGNRNNALILPSQSTQAGFGFFNPSWSANTSANPKLPVELHQMGRLYAEALELNAPIDHKFGARYELVYKKQPLAAMDVTNVKAPDLLGGLELKGYAMYGEVWWWMLGDDRIIGEPGMQMPTRYNKFGVKAPQNGLMLAARVDYLNETISSQDAVATSLKSPIEGRTKVTAYELGLNYWYSKRFRATFNYVLNHMDGDTPSIVKLKSKNEQEFLFRLGIAL